MTSACIVCGSTPDVQPSLPQIIGSFREVLKVLEAQALRSESENAGKLKKLNLQIDELTARSHSLEQDKISAQKRSDLYKDRFLSAQKAIQQLHEKNLQLSGRKTLKSSQLNRDSAVREFPFGPKQEFSPETKRVILAPDTCAQGEESHYEDVTYISSDEEDFKQESHRKSKAKSPHSSLKTEMQRTPGKSIVDSFFHKPNLMPKKQKMALQTPKLCSDLDETRLDGCDPMDTSITLDLSEQAKLDEEMDSIPPSPILSGGKDRRFGLFHGLRGSFPKYNGPQHERNMGSLQDNKEKRFPVISIPLKKDLEASSLKNSPTPGDLKPQVKESDLSHKSKPANVTYDELPGNTSLDALFDKTYGDLETTAMLKDSTVELKDVKREEESDEDLDALLLEGVEDAALCTTQTDATFSKASVEVSPKPVLETNPKKKPVWEDSFDFAPRRREEKNFKYQEVVRKRSERGILDGKPCAQCEAYYRDVPDEERTEILRKLCRHKHVYAPPSTPEHFWEIGIPNTEECRRRGYFVDEKDLPPEERACEPRLRRKKPLEPFFSKKK